MKIVSLTAENVKRLTAVHIEPSGNLVEITGRNGAGKSSVLDCIWWALAGAKHIQAAPIRKGAKTARIVLDMGEIVVTRTFDRSDDGETTTKLKVSTPAGANFPKGQSMIGNLVGALSMDPLAFMRMPAAEQFEALKGFVPDVDFDSITRAQQADFDARTELNREAKALRGAADILGGQIGDVAGIVRVDEAALVAQLEQAGQTNTDIERKRSERGNARATMESHQQQAKQKRERAEQLRAEADDLDTQAADHEGRAGKIRHGLRVAEPVPEKVDTAAVRQQIDAARANNEVVRKIEERAAKIEQAEKHEARAQELTDALAARKAATRAKIAEATLPVPGLGFGDGEIMLNDVPLAQASDAEQLRVAVAMAIAGSPHLKVIRVRDGSLLDADGLRLLAEMADAADCQVWVERVDTSGAHGIVIEDGHVQGQVLEAAE